MSLLEDASLLVTPNAEKATKLYSIIPTNGNGDFTVTRATTATRTNSSGLIESTPINEPRLDYSLGSCPNILVEPQRTNLALRSEEFNDILWVKLRASVTNNTTSSPSGETNADTISVTSGGSASYFGQLVTTTATTINVSIYCKYINQQFIQIWSSSSATAYANFDIQNGVVGTVGANASSAQITNAANGFYRLSVTLTVPIAAINFRFSFAASSTSAYNPSEGVAGRQFYAWGAQFESGAYQTSYIPTTTASVTRNADVISKTGISSLIGQTQGTIFAEIKVSKLLGAVSRYIFHVSDGTADNRIYVAFGSAASNQIRGRIFFGGVLQCSINSSTITSTGTYKLALAYNNNDVVLYINGVQVGVDTSATIPACSRVDVGENYAGASQFSDGITISGIWQTRLTNTQLAALTTL
jgi:hypothetical protein